MSCHAQISLYNWLLNVFFPEYSRLYGLKHEVNFKVKIKINKVGKNVQCRKFEVKIMKCRWEKLE